MHKQIHIGVRNSHKWTRYVALSVALIVAPITGTLAVAATSSSTPGAVVVADSSSSALVAAPNSSKWV